MRGPLDDTVVSEPEVRREGASADQAERPRPVGGKALVRLLQLLESASLDESAEAAIEMAVPQAARKAFDASLTRFSASPHAVVGEDNGARPRTRRRRSLLPGATDAKPGAAGQDAGSVAQASIRAAERLGPPNPVLPQWRSLGPWTVPNGQTYGASRVNVAGRVSAVAVDPNDPAHVLVGAAHGGVWESRDRGASWGPRSDYASTLTVGALVFDKTDPRTVYCGTGEGNWWSWLGAGILRSVDGGTTWSPRCTTPFVGQGFYDLIVDPGDRLHLLAATTGGLYVSTDAGVNWSRRRTQGTWSLSIAAAGGASAEILAASTDGVRRSTNGGTTWAAVTLPGAPTAWDRLAVAIAPSNPRIAYVWGSSNGTPYLWRRAAGTWRAIGTPPGVATGQAWYDWFLGIAPDRASQIYCGAIEVHRGDLASGVWSWQNITNKGVSGDSIHPDQHVIAFETGAPATIYVGNDGGLYRSPDRGTTWQHCNNGLVISEFEYIAHNIGSSRWLIGGTQDNGTERWTGSQIWDQVAGGDGGDCGANRTTPPTVFHTYYGMSPERSTLSGDPGTWAWLPPPVPANEGSLFYPPFECSATNGDTVAMGGDAVYISRNGATTWARLAFPVGGRSNAMYIPNADDLYVGTTDGRIFRTTWNGTSWAALSALTTPRAGAGVSDLFVDPSNRSRMWATSRTVGGGRVFRSDDGGGAWIDQSAGLPGLPINAVEVDPWNTDRVWVAADLGVYQSWDAGATWADYSNGLPHMYVGDLLLHPHARVLRAGTRNRGVWEIPVDGWMTQPACGVQWVGSLPGNASGTWFTHSWPATWQVIWTIMPTSPRPGAEQVSWVTQVERPSAEFATYWITVRNLTPDVLTFEGRFCVLSRY